MIQRPPSIDLTVIPCSLSSQDDPMSWSLLLSRELEEVANTTVQSSEEVADE